MGILPPHRIVLLVIQRKVRLEFIIDVLVQSCQVRVDLARSSAPNTLKSGRVAALVVDISKDGIVLSQLSFRRSDVLIRPLQRAVSRLQHARAFLKLFLAFLENRRWGHRLLIGVRRCAQIVVRSRTGLIRIGRSAQIAHGAIRALSVGNDRTHLTSRSADGSRQRVVALRRNAQVPFRSDQLTLGSIRIAADTREIIAKLSDIRRAGLTRRVPRSAILTRRLFD